MRSSELVADVAVTFATRVAEVVDDEDSRETLAAVLGTTKPDCECDSASVTTAVVVMAAMVRGADVLVDAGTTGGTRPNGTRILIGVDMSGAIVALAEGNTVEMLLAASSAFVVAALVATRFFESISTCDLEN